MVLETIINPISAERKPWHMIFIGMLYSGIAIFLSYWVFAEYVSLVMVFLTALVCAPLLYNVIKLEEKKDMVVDEEITLLKEHWKVLSFLVFLFIGFVITFSLCYALMPNDMAQHTFSIQTNTISAINSNATGNFYGLNDFWKIFSNNLKVLVFCIIFAFIYGLGAIFILTWNASVIGAAIGIFIRVNISSKAAELGYPSIVHYFTAIPIGLLRYALHGIPEIAAYFIGGIAGSIISVAVINHDLGTKKYEKILLDTSNLVIIAIVILFFAALLEVYVTPLLF
ncbi:MAG: stage II sporulation protein M [Candidatus Nanoarchaeia archaeon]|nr:stage II sporulation protein M [Candidatus Nanoarchaeia archaeon]